MSGLDDDKGGLGGELDRPPLALFSESLLALLIHLPSVGDRLVDELRFFLLDLASPSISRSSTRVAEESCRDMDDVELEDRRCADVEDRVLLELVLFVMGAGL